MSDQTQRAEKSTVQQEVIKQLMRDLEKAQNQRDIYQTDALKKAQHITRIDNRFKAFTRMNFARMAKDWTKDELIAEIAEWQKLANESISGADRE